MLWTHNATWGISPDTEEGRILLSWLPVVGWILITVAVVTILFNVVLIAAILVHEHSRSRSFHLHIVNFAVAAVLQGAAVLPIWSLYLMEGTWILGDSLCRCWLAADTLATTVASLGLVMMACDRFIYLLCWRDVREGGKYIMCSIFMALSWLLAVALTLTLTLTTVQESGGGVSRSGVLGNGQCGWGAERDRRVVAARLIVYAIGAGLGAGLSLALVTMACCGLGHLLPIDEDDDSVDWEVPSEVSESEVKGFPASGSPLTTQDGHGKQLHGKPRGEDEDFPLFNLHPGWNRQEERELWRWQVSSLLSVAMAWAVMWLPSHLFVFAHVLHLEWESVVPHSAVVAVVVLGYANATVTPLLWLLHGPVRRAIVDVLFCRCCRAGEEEEGESSSNSSLMLQDVGPYRATEVTA